MILLLILISTFLGIFTKFHLLFSIIIFLGLIVFLFFRYKKKILLVSITAFLTGLGTRFIHFDLTLNSYHGVVIESKENYFIVSNLLEKYYVYQKDNQYEIGDILEIKSNKSPLEFNMIESSFDFASYLNKKGVYYELDNSNIEVHFSTPIRLKAMKTNFLAHFDELSASLMKGILFSSIDDNESTYLFKNLHLTRLLSTSGVYLLVIYKLINKVTTKIFKDKVGSLISIFFFILINIFTFPKFNVIRFTSFLIFRFINEYILKHKLSYISLLSLNGLFFIFIDYNITYSISYILCYSLSIFSYFTFNLVKNYSKYKRKIYHLIILYFYFIPIELYFYHEFAIFSYIFNLILTPLFIVVMILGILCLLFIPLYPMIRLFTNGIINISKVLSYINISIYAPGLSDILLAIYYLIYIVLLCLIVVHFKPFIRLLSLIAVIFFILYFVPYKNFISQEVSFINVGQGDACLIRKGFTTILIDTGGSNYFDIANDNLIPYLKSKRIYNIDLLITTHDDLDHSGGVNNLMKYFKVARYIKDDEDFPLTISGITLINYNNHVDKNNEENDKSLVIGFNLFNTDFLIMGDAPIAIENYIMEEYSSVPCDILKVGHHGSDTSSSNKFINFLKPKAAIISVGKNNKYGHPHSRVLSTLRYYNVEIHRTDLEGTISYYAYGI